MMTDRDSQEDRLAADLDALGARRAVPSEALIARVMADADAEAPKLRAAGGAADETRAKPLAARYGWWTGVKSILGGAPGAAGLASAMVVGLWVGAFPPATVSALEEALLGTPVIVDIGEDLAVDLGE